MSLSPVSVLGKSFYTYSKKTATSASSKKAADSDASASVASAAGGTTISNEAGDSISLSKAGSEGAASAAQAVQEQSGVAATLTELEAETGSVLDTETSEKINAMLDEAEKVADLYEQSLSQMSAFSDFLKASLNSESEANNLYKALGLDSASTFTSAMSSLQAIVNERYTSLTDSILSAAGGEAEAVAVAAAQ